MLDLFLAVCCSLIVASIFKYAGKKNLHRVGLLTANYAVASITSMAALFMGDASWKAVALDSPLFIVVATVTGALFIYAFFLMAQATQVSGMSLTVGVMRLSVVIPFLASWMIWNEAPSAWRVVGMVVAGVAFFLISSRGSAEGAAGGASHLSLPLVLLFLMMGAIDTILKWYNEDFVATHPKAYFMSIVFGVAFLLGLAQTVMSGLRSKRWPETDAIVWGIALGIVNYGSVFFLLRAIRELSGTFVFPVNNISLVIGGSLLGMVLWKERLSRVNLAGIAVAAVALLLLSF